MHWYKLVQIANVPVRTSTNHPRLVNWVLITKNNRMGRFSKLIFCRTRRAPLPSEASVEKSRRDLCRATIFAVCASLASVCRTKARKCIPRSQGGVVYNVSCWRYRRCNGHKKNLGGDYLRLFVILCTRVVYKKLRLVCTAAVRVRSTHLLCLGTEPTEEACRELQQHSSSRLLPKSANVIPKGTSRSHRSGHHLR